MKTKKLTTCGYGIAMLCFCLACHPTYAVFAADKLILWQDSEQKQRKQLTGTVRDAQGVLAGVIVRAGTVAVTTNEEGKYTVAVAVGEKISFSMMGYKEQTLVYAGGSELNIILAEDNSMLDEIVVNAGYYTVKERESTGSIARITAKDIEFQPITNALQAMQGRMAGVSITQNSGVPGGGFDIEIRGKNSLNTKLSEPLYIINGVPILNNNLSQSTMSGSILPNRSINILNTLNPNDIESIEVLKDADATAIYGSRGANGVVLITTKQGKSDTTEFSISSFTAFNKVASKMKLMNATEFNQMRQEAFDNDQITNYPAHAYDMIGIWDKNRNVDWQKELIGKTAMSQDIQVGVAGGNQNNRYRLTFNKFEQSSVFPTDKKYKRNSANFNYNHISSDKKFRLNTSTSFSQMSNELIQTDLTAKALTLAPIAPPLYKPDGTLNWDYGIYGNPIAPMLATYDYDNKSLLLNMDLSYQLIKDVYLKLNTGLTTNDFQEIQLTPHTINNPASGATSASSSALKALNNSFSYIVEPQINYNITFAQKHAISFIVGATFQSDSRSKLSVRASDFPSDILLSNLGSAKNKTITDSGNSQYKYAALFARLNYMYKDTYIVNLTGRRDGSSRFGDNNKFGNFGAIGAAWVFSNESIFSGNSWLSFGKIRGSYGITGSDNIGDYQYLDTYSVGAYSYGGVIGATPSRLFNPNFSWEKTKKLEVALDFSLINNRIQSSVAWYKNTTDNQLVGIPLPATTGFTSIQDNLPAKVQNTGWEFTLLTHNITSKDWRWTTSFNISWPKNKLIAFPGIESSTYASTYIVGQSLSAKKFYNYLGIDPLTGLYQFTDYNKDGKLTALDDKQVIKELGVQYHGGLSNSIAYKNFSVDFLFQFVKQTSLNYNSVISTPGSIMNQPIEVMDRWRVDNTNSAYAFYTTGVNPTVNALTSTFKESTTTVSDASFIRLKNISLSYQFSVVKTKDVRLFVQGQNLWTLTNYFGLDPEFLTLGYLPPLKTYSFGFQLTL